MVKPRNERKLKEQWAREIDPGAWELPNNYEKGKRRVAAYDKAMVRLVETRDSLPERAN